MSRLGTWGDHLTLQAAADAYGVRICLVTSFTEGAIIHICPTQLPQQAAYGAQQRGDGPALWLSFWAEVHYNSLACKAPAAPGGGGGGSSSSSSSGSEQGRGRLLGSRKLRRAANAAAEAMHLR